MTTLQENHADQIATFENWALPSSHSDLLLPRSHSALYTVVLKYLGESGLWRARGIGFHLDVRLGTRDVYKARAQVAAMFQRQVSDWQPVSDGQPAPQEGRP